MRRWHRDRARRARLQVHAGCLVQGPMTTVPLADCVHEPLRLSVLARSGPPHGQSQALGRSMEPWTHTGRPPPPPGSPQDSPQSRGQKSLAAARPSSTE